MMADSAAAKKKNKKKRMWRERFQSRCKQLTIDHQLILFFFRVFVVLFIRETRFFLAGGGSMLQLRSESILPLMAYMAAVHAITPDASFCFKL
jgi:Na+/H+ antiporter NhaD/arsenite permease-like protein